MYCLNVDIFEFAVESYLNICLGRKKKEKKGKQLLGLYYRSILIAIANVLIGYDQNFSLSSSVKKFQRKYLLNDDVL